MKSKLFLKNFYSIISTYLDFRKTSIFLLILANIMVFIGLILPPDNATAIMQDGTITHVKSYPSAISILLWAFSSTPFIIGIKKWFEEE